MVMNIKSERVRIGLTQEELADLIGAHVNTIRLWENGERQPSSNGLISLSRLFGCTADYLLGLTEERTFSSEKRSCS